MKALSIRDLRKVYSDGTEAVRGIDLDVEAGDFFALLGPNGAGKTTTIGIVTSLVNKTGGKVEVFGTDTDVDFATAKSNIGLVPQEVNFNMFETCEQIVMNQAGYYGIDRTTAKARAEKYLRELDLWEKRNQVSRNLSGGMKRRLMIARALVHEPKLLILDEPTAGVDIEIRRSMWAFLRKINAEGTTIILTTHYLEEAESLCRNIAIINKGRIAENTRMKNLLEKLHVETFILDMQDDVADLSGFEQFQLKKVDDRTLEAEITKENSINELFAALSDKGMKVLSMRNKVNRLEELFVRMVEDQNKEPAA
ncbi:MAG: ABC transporter ATP-binding protein [Gammaproteobacteria bacterium]|nr:ABC transporter ATP-binding protein [Gammaproteobacteria bacterium]